jgi:gluconokinase
VTKLVVASLEVSTSSAKCILYSSDRGVIAEATSRYAPDVADGPTQDPHGVLECALGVLRRVVHESQALGLRIEALGLTGTWHSLVALDAGRRPLARINTWADLSGAPWIAPLRADQGFVRRAYRSTGCMVHAMYPAWKWYSLKKRDPELAASTRFVSSQVEYVFEALTGCARVSRSIASGTGMFNIFTLDWDDNVLSAVGIRREQLGQLEEAFYTAPLRASFAEQVNLPSGLPVTVGCSDGAMNQLAIGALHTGVMSMSVGTSGALRTVHMEPKIPDTPSTWCYYLLDGRRLSGAAVNNGTNCVDWFLQRHVAQDVNPAVYDSFSYGATLVDRATAPIFLPFVFGERCPGWNEDRTGGFVGVRASHDKFDLYYSILEGVLFGMRQCYDILVDVGGRPDRVVVSGGIVNSDLWMQMAADVFGRELDTTGVINDSTVGGALVALQAVGGSESRVLDRYIPQIARSLEPHDGAVQLSEERYERYLEIYRLLDVSLGSAAAEEQHAVPSILEQSLQER